MGLPEKGRVVVRRGEIWWADIPEPLGSEPGFTRPVIVIQGNRFNNSRIGTVVVVAITSNLQLGDAAGSVFIGRSQSGLPRDSVVNVSQVSTLDKYSLTDRVGRLPDDLMSEVESGLRLVLGL